MKRPLLALPVLLALAACDGTGYGMNGLGNNKVATSAAAGGVIGAAIADDGDRLEGAAIGAGLGAAAAVLVDRMSDNTCVYRDTMTGGTYRAACP